MAHTLLDHIEPNEAENKLFTTVKAALQFQIERQKQNGPHLEHPSHPCQQGQGGTKTITSDSTMSVSDTHSCCDGGKSAVGFGSKNCRFIDYSKTEVRCAGGWVRDKLLGLQPDDIDLAISNMTGLEFAECVNQYRNSLNKKATKVRQISTL